MSSRGCSATSSFTSPTGTRCRSRRWLRSRSDPDGDRILSTARSFGRLGPARRDATGVARLRIVRAQPAETFTALSERTGNAWDARTTAIYNGRLQNHRFAGGELVKVTEEGE